MDVQTFQNLTKPREEYHRVKVIDLTFKDNELEVPGVGVFTLSDAVFTSLCRFVGIPKGLNRSLFDVNRSLWEQVVKELYRHYGGGEVVLKLVDGELVGITNVDRDPVSNERFINRVISYFDDITEVEVDDIHFNPKHQMSSVISLLSKGHINSGEEYRVGVVIENDSLYGVNVKLAVKKLSDSTYVYGTPSIFNLSSARYNRTSDTGFDALNSMLVTLGDGLRGEFFQNQVLTRLDQALYKEENVKITYEEYYRSRQIIQRALNLSSFDEDSVKKVIEDFRDLFDFYQNYYSVQEADYIWRHTAYSDCTVRTARQFISSLANNVSLVYEAQRDLRLFAGELMFGKSLFHSIAIRK